MEERLQTYIAGRIAAGAFRSIDPALGARAVIGMFLGLMLPVIRGLASPPTAKERRALAETITELILEGVLFRET